MGRLGSSIIVWLALIALCHCSRGRLSLSGDTNPGTSPPGFSPTDPTQWSLTPNTPLQFDDLVFSRGSTGFQLLQLDQLDDDNSRGGFGSGTHLNTNWQGASLALQSTGTNLNQCGQGCYTSRLLDAGGPVDWTKISWVPDRPQGKELYVAGQPEAGYPMGSLDYQNIALLFHLNETTAGSFTDQSRVPSMTGGPIVGVCSNCPTPVLDGKLAGAYSFSGNQSINLGMLERLKSVQSLTVMAWIKMSSAHQGTILGHTYSPLVFDNANGFSFGVSQNRLYLASFGIEFYVAPNANLRVGEWHHVAAVLNANTAIQFFVDGKLVNSVPSLGAYRTPDADSVLIGNGYYGGFLGSLDEIALYKSALSEASILDHYARGAHKATFRVRSCASPCTNEPFIGEYSELQNQTALPPSFDLLGVPRNRYFQYQVQFESLFNPSVFPGIRRVEILPPHFPLVSTPIQLPTPIRLNQLSVFQEVLGPGGASSAKYQVSPDGVTWFYVRNGLWSQANSPLDSSTAQEIMLGKQSLDPLFANKSFYFRVFLFSDGLNPASWSGVNVR